MDKSWMEITDRGLPEYERGVDEFLNFAFSKTKKDKIRCPCLRCNNGFSKTRDEVKGDLFFNGIVRGYTRWIHHGESFYSSSSDDESNDEDVDDMHGLIHDVHGFGVNYTTSREYSGEHDLETPNEDATKFFRLLSEADQEIYPGCENFSKLSFIVRLFHMKCLSGWSNKSFDILLKLFKELLPKGHLVPDSHYEAKKIIRDLGLNYVKIDACENDCILYWKEHVDAIECPVCGTPRWSSEKKVPRKVLRHFPLKPRLQRLFMSTKIAEDMRWHMNEKNDDGIMRHPSDSKAWKHFDEQHEAFATELRNVRLGLASDGFNPFGIISVSHSTWPVVLVPYNLPPWKCMKQPFFMMSLLIPGPTSPGNNIDVYLQPLIEELKELWEVGVNTYDAFAKENFQLRAAVLWTINDFPAYANLSGWSTKGYYACPCCNKDKTSIWLNGSHKLCFMRHRRFLPRKHKWRSDQEKFDNTVEEAQAPQKLSGDDILHQLDNLGPNVFGKVGTTTVGTKRKREDDHNWKKKSIFFDLPYWRTLLLRHNLDVMHIEKNICESVLHTLMNTSGKTKDTIGARLDLFQFSIREKLQPSDKGQHWEMPAACYTLSAKERKNLCEFLKSVKFPDGYSSNISRCLNTKDGKIMGLKSHDCHVLLQHLLPLAIRGNLPKEVCVALIELSAFFKELTAKAVKLEVLERLQKQIAITLCRLEMIYPPAFFDVMVHLAIHLPDEALIAGPVQYRWMYPIERYLRTLKSYVRNKAHPEGSIAEGYIAEECLNFCSMYLRGVETKFNRPERNYDGDQRQVSQQLSVFSHSGRLVGQTNNDLLSQTEYNQARWYVLNNCEEVWPFIDEHKELLERESLINIDQRHEKEFPTWFEMHVTKLYKEGNARVSEQLLNIARGPDKRVSRYKACIVNGSRFRVKHLDKLRKTQNSGVAVKGDDLSDNINYYGVLTDIVELHYIGGNRVVLFKCDWWDVSRLGYKVDEYGETMINVGRKLSTNEPYVLGSQAEQVYYINDNKNPNWQFVIKNDPRNLYNMPDDEDEDTSTLGDEAYQQNESCSALSSFDTLDDNNNSINWIRTDVDAAQVDPTLIEQEREKNAEEKEWVDEEGDDTFIDDDDLDTMMFDD